MRITVLGKSPSWQDEGGACSGYLVQQDDHALLLDCGNGVFAKLRCHFDYRAVDSVLLTHLHADHFLDLVPFAYALTFGPAPSGQRPRPRLHAPRGAAALFRRVVGAWGEEDLIERSFELREYDPAVALEDGPLAIRLQPVPHFVPTCAVELRAGGRRFTFGADCGPNDELVELARETDLLLLEATLPDSEVEAPPRGHLSAREAGEHAARAGARRLVITHLTDELDAAAARAQAAAAFGAPVEVAAEGAVYEL